MGCGRRRRYYGYPPAQYDEFNQTEERSKNVQDPGISSPLDFDNNASNLPERSVWSRSLLEARKLCQVCGEELQIEDRFCFNCGTRQV